METYRFEVGAFKCLAILDGMIDISATSVFANAPDDQLDAALAAYGVRDRVLNSPIICLVIDTGDHRALVDTGCGDAALPDAGKLLGNLVAEHVMPETIDTVILTHGHWDHVAGNADARGAPTFPNACYVMCQDEWDAMTASSTLAQMEAADAVVTRANLTDLADRYRFVQGATEIVPGVAAVPAAGHTPGHMAAMATSGNNRLLCTGDAAIHPIHLTFPDWQPDFDAHPAQAIASRARLLERAVDEDALVFAPHFPFPGIGHVRQVASGWAWQPIQLEG